MSKKKSKLDKPKLELLLSSNRAKTKFKEEILLKEVVDNLILSLIMSLDAIEEVDNSVIFGEMEKRHLYAEILDALEYSIDVGMGGQQAFLKGMDLRPDEFYFMKGKD